MTTEIIFEVIEAIEGGYTARALGESIFTEADNWEELKSNIKDAVNCHFNSDELKPKVIRLHFIKDEAFAL